MTDGNEHDLLARSAVSVIRLEGIGVKYGNVTALENATCSIPRAGLHGILGPNGAGKSTLIHIIAGLQAPDSGTVIQRPAVGSVAMRIGYQPEEPALYDYLTVAEFLELAAIVAGTADDGGEIRRLMAAFELDTAAGRLTHALSAGSRRKLSIVAALVQKPDLLILDEPTNGLDARAVSRLKQELSRLRGLEVPIVLSTHILDFAAALCDSVTLLSHGRVVFDGSVDMLPGYDGPSTFERIVSTLLDL